MQESVIPPLMTPLPRMSSSRKLVIRACRPSLIDLRFKGDPWVVQREKHASVCLGDFPMGQVNVSPLDVPSLNRAFQQVRLGQARRTYTRRLRLLAIE
jgi:hypothetical protein